jgi:CRISPR RNA silencing complex Cmr2 subunit-like protein
MPDLLEENDLLEGFSKALGVPADGALRAYVRDGKGLPPANAKLLAWDANSIHSFVFDTTNATGIRGASDILRRIDAGLGDGASLGLSKGQVLFSGGGSGLAVVAECEVGRCMERLHEIFAKETWIATCTAATVDLAAGEGAFNERVGAVGRALGTDRILTGPDAEPAVPFFVARCAVCGRRAAALSKRRVGTGDEGRLECQPCHDRIEQGKKNVHYEGEPSDFAAIADGEGKGFYAAVYLDGNGIGRTITQLPSPLAYASFSRAIDAVIKKSFDEVAKGYGLVEDGGERAGGYQRPICGGDDVVAILPGEVAVPFTRDLLSLLEKTAEANSDLKGKGIGASAGVAIGHSKFPIRHLLAEAEGLLRVAKRRAYDDKEKGQDARSTLSFAVVTDGSPRSETVEPERWKRTKDELLLSGRPYTLPELVEFSRRFRTIRDATKVGRTQLYSLHTHAVRGPRQFRNHVLYQIGRREEWGELAVALGSGDKALLRNPDLCEAQFAPTYSDRRVFDVADMIDLLGHWREPKEEKAP